MTLYDEPITKTRRTRGAFIPFQPYVPTEEEAAALKADGWRSAGDVQWYPPYPGNLSYTYRAAVLQLEIDSASLAHRKTPAQIRELCA